MLQTETEEGEKTVDVSAIPAATFRSLYPSSVHYLIA